MLIGAPNSYYTRARRIRLSQATQEDIQAKPRVTSEDAAKIYAAKARKAGPTPHDKLSVLLERKRQREAILGQ